MQRRAGETLCVIVGVARAAPHAESCELRVSGAISNEEDAVTNIERRLLELRDVAGSDVANQRRWGCGQWQRREPRDIEQLEDIGRGTCRGSGCVRRALGQADRRSRLIVIDRSGAVRTGRHVGMVMHRLGRIVRRIRGSGVLHRSHVMVRRRGFRGHSETRSGGQAIPGERRQDRDRDAAPPSAELCKPRDSPSHVVSIELGA